MKLLLRLVGLLVVLSVVAGFHASMSAQTAAPKPLAAASSPTDKALEAAKAEIKKAADDQLEERVKKIEERASNAILEGQRKSIDWWIAMLSILTGLVALGGAVIPFLMARKEKDAIEIGLRAVESAVQSVTAARGEIERLRTESDESHQKTLDNEKATKDAYGRAEKSAADTQLMVEKANALLNQVVVSPEATPDTNRAQQAAAQTILASSESTPLERLRAQAVQASQDEDTELAWLLWERVSKQNPEDGKAAFNYAYWLQDKTGKLPQPTVTDWQIVSKAYAIAEKLDQGVPKNRWILNNWGNALSAEAKAWHTSGDLEAARDLWRQAREKFAEALRIKPDMYEAAYNWGVALHAEAVALSASGDLNAARDLWRQAGETYAEALRIKPDQHEAPYNWGNALDDEAQALNASGDLNAARDLWRKAGEKYAQVLRIKPDKHEAATNWGNALDAEAQALNASGDLKAARDLWRKAGEKYAQVLRIKPDYYEAAFNWGYALSVEAHALQASGDLKAAQGLWRQVGEKYAQALRIKPDKYEAASNWGVALNAEAVALSASGDLNAARDLWRQAGEKYTQALRIKPDMHDAADNWGTSMLLEHQAIKSLDPTQASKLLEQARMLLEKHSQMEARGREAVAYNLACVYALKGDATKCIEQLEINRLSKKPLRKAHIESDKDFDGIRHTPEFQAWWKKNFGD